MKDAELKEYFYSFGVCELLTKELLFCRWLRGRASASLSEGRWFNSPGLLLVCMEATAISAWITVSCFGQKHLLNAVKYKFKIEISVRGDVLTYFPHGMHKNTSRYRNRNVCCTLRKITKTLGQPQQITLSAISHHIRPLLTICAV